MATAAALAATSDGDAARQRPGARGPRAPPAQHPCRAVPL
jgi:hypothetical protein